MKQTLYIIRHGETKWNEEHRWQGNHDSELTSQGKLQARMLKAHLSKIKFDKVYVSPSKRAIETAKIILAERDITPIVCDKLQEISLGKWEGLTFEETQLVNPIEYYNFWNAPNKFNLPGAETFEQVTKRVAEVVEDIFSENEIINSLIISHLTAIKCMIAYCWDISVAEISAMPDIALDGYIAIEKMDDKITVQYFGGS